MILYKSNYHTERTLREERVKMLDLQKIKYKRFKTNSGD
jgi:hypothetical protein